VAAEPAEPAVALNLPEPGFHLKRDERAALTDLAPELDRSSEQQIRRPPAGKCEPYGAKDDVFGKQVKNRVQQPRRA
jgi:hypothetical protein